MATPVASLPITIWLLAAAALKLVFEPIAILFEPLLRFKPAFNPIPTFSFSAPSAPPKAFAPTATLATPVSIPSKAL